MHDTIEPREHETPETSGAGPASAAGAPAAGRPSPVRWILVLLLATLLVYSLDGDRGIGGALGSGFAFDDIHLIVENPRLAEGGAAFDGFTGDYYAAGAQSITGEERALGYYRPLAVLSNWLDHTIWGLRPFGYHLTNLLLHAGVVLLFFLLIDRLSGKRPLAFVAALLFAVHPVHVESVTFISGRVDVLAAFFSLLSLWFLARSFDARGAARPLAISLLFFLCALLSKEMAVTLPAAVVVLAWLYGPAPRSLARALLRAVPYVGVIGVYAVVRLGVLGELTSRASAARDAGETLRQVAVVVSEYLGLLLWPPAAFNVEPFLLIPIEMNARVILGVVVIVALAVIALLPPVRRRVPACTAGILWMLAAIVPVSHVLPVETLIGERYMYIPSLGAMLAVAGLLTWLASRGRSLAGTSLRVLLLVAAVTSALYGANTIHRNRYWQDNLEFWKAKCALTPSAESYTAAGIEFARAGDAGGAAKSFSLALESDPDHLEALNNYALILLEDGLTEEALQLASRAATLNPRYAEALNTAANAFHAMGYFPQAVGQYKRAIRVRPDYREAWVNLGNTYLAAGIPDSAWRAYDEALEIAPDRELRIQAARCIALAEQSPAAMDYLYESGVVQPETSEAYLLQGTFDALTGYGDAAVASMIRATELNPESVEAWSELGQLLDMTGRRAQARAALERAAELAPENPIVHTNLGVFYKNGNNLEEALVHFTRAVEVGPNDVVALRNLGGALLDAGNVDLAIDVLNRAVSNGRDAMALFYRGAARQQKGALSPAITDYRAAIALNPRLTEAYLRLGTLYALSDRSEQALHAYQSFLRFSSPNDNRRERVMEAMQGLTGEEN